jgi:hypothetical protein
VTETPIVLNVPPGGDRGNAFYRLTFLERKVSSSATGVWIRAAQAAIRYLVAQRQEGQ